MRSTRFPSQKFCALIGKWWEHLLTNCLLAVFLSVKWNWIDTISRLLDVIKGLGYKEIGSLERKHCLLFQKHMLIIYTDSQIWSSDVSGVFDWMLLACCRIFVLGRVYIFLSDLLYFVLKADVYVKSCHNPKQIKDHGCVCLKTLSMIVSLILRRNHTLFL